MQECGEAYCAEHAELALWHWWHTSRKLFLLILCFAEAHGCLMLSGISWSQGDKLLLYEARQMHAPLAVLKRYGSTHSEQRRR
jgi:hypothetical protein